MVKLVYFTEFAPSATGHGGNHRSYQIMAELERLVGKDNVILMHHAPEYASYQSSNTLMQMAEIVKQRTNLLLKILLFFRRYFKWIETLLSKSTDPVHHFGFVPTGEYEKILGKDGKPSICVIDHPSHRSLISINKKRGIPTIICPHNIESFDIKSVNVKQEWSTYTLTNNFVYELKVLADCDDRLCISKVETGLLGGLGISSGYYPYFPVGALREGLMRIRQKRIDKKIDPNLFFMLGTASHLTTGDSFRWFLENVKSFGLPKNVRVVIGGDGTDKLLSKQNLMPGVELKGWLEQGELDDLLTRANAILIPQRTGFGALTRVPEMACAGIPVIMSEHPSYAMHLPPGVITVNDHWVRWIDQMERLRRKPITPHEDEYLEWEQQQPDTLRDVIESYLARS